MKIQSNVHPRGSLSRPIGTSLALLALLAAPLAQAQSQPTGITLTCSPTSTGNTATLNTAAGVWGIDKDGSGITPAAAYYPDTSPWVAGPAGSGAWIGGTSPPAVSSVVNYSVQVNADDPNIVLSSATIAYEYVVDDFVTDITWNGSALPYSGDVTYTTTPFTQAATPVTLVNGSNLLRFSTSDSGSMHGLNAKVALTFDCQARAGGVNAVPMDNPLTLAALTAALGMAGGAVAVRRRRRRN